MNDYYLLAVAVILFWRNNLLHNRITAVVFNPDVKQNNEQLKYMLNHAMVCTLLGYAALITSFVLWIRG